MDFLLQRQRIVDLLHAYCRGVDDNRPAEVAELFAEDCVFVSSTGGNGTVHGRVAVQARLAKLLAGFSATSHHLSNIEIDFADDDHATGISYLYAWHRFDGDRPDALLWARYHDTFVQVAGRWQIAERTLRVTGDQAMPFGWQPPLPARA